MLYTNNFENLEKNNDNSIILTYVIVGILAERRVFESLLFNLRCYLLIKGIPIN